MATGGNATVYNYPDLTQICYLYNSSSPEYNIVYGPITSKQLRIDIETLVDSVSVYIKSDNKEEVALLSNAGDGAHVVDIPEQFLRENPLYLQNSATLQIENQIVLPPTIQITCSTPESKIYYTLDGNTPSSSSTLYSDTFTADIGTTIKAIGIKEGYLDSDIAEFTVV